MATTTRGQVAVLTSDGQIVPLEVVDLPALPDTADSPSLKGTVALREFLHLPADVQVAGVAAFGTTVALVTAAGKVKRLDLDQTLKQSMGLDPKDRLVAAFTVAPDSDLVFISSAGQLLRTAADAVPVQGAGARGVAGMKLKNGAVVVAAAASDADSFVVTVAGYRCERQQCEGHSAGKALPFPTSTTPGRLGTPAVAKMLIGGAAAPPLLSPACSSTRCWCSGASWQGS
ncbi:MAG: DNA gyrase C-terminal beta-propeller domain-containing protein [Candidatus Nanopelagicales bacterium]